MIRRYDLRIMSDFDAVLISVRGGALDAKTMDMEFVITTLSP